MLVEGSLPPLIFLNFLCEQILQHTALAGSTALTFDVEHPEML